MFTNKKFAKDIVISDRQHQLYSKMRGSGLFTQTTNVDEFLDRVMVLCSLRL